MQVNAPLNDYSHQWLEYYRSLGMIREAELLEQQISINHESQGQMLQQEYVGYQQGYLGDNQQEYLNVYQQEYLNHNQQENLEQNQQQQLHAEPKYEPISPDSDVIEITDAKDCEQQKQLQQQQLHQQQLQQQQLQQQQLQQQQLQQQKQEEQKNEQEVMQLIQKLQQIEQQQKIQRLQQEQQKQATEMQFKLRLLLEYCQRVLETQVLEQHSKEHKAKESELKTWQQEQEYDQQNYSEQQLQLGKIYETASTSTSLQEDYTDQWIEYYRTIGQTKEAEILEYNKRLKVKKPSPSAGCARGGRPLSLSPPS